MFSCAFFFVTSLFYFFFFFSSRRRHTRCSRDWSSDVCSSDLFLMQHIPDRIFRPVIGWIVLSMVILQTIHRLRPSIFQNTPHSQWFGWIMGGWSGVTTMVANAAGPVMTLYLLSVNLPKFEFVGTGAWFFLVINIFKLPFSYSLGLINGGSLTFNSVLVPSVLLGVLVGRKLIGIIPQKLFELLLLLFAAAASLRLVWAS